MRIYFSGIGGVGIGPLAEIARDAGYDVVGSDAKESLMTSELLESGIGISYDQSGENLATEHVKQPIDWFVHTSALPVDHPELVQAVALGIRTAKRDELINQLIKEKGLKLIAVAGTHGKTTTTAMLVWTLQQLGIPASYSIGSGVNFGPSGSFDPTSQFFVYECDEFDRNFLHFTPYLSLITSIDFDHPDTYPTQADYAAAFTQFIAQSSQSIMWDRDTVININTPISSWRLHDNEVMEFAIAGLHNRQNATLITKACEYMQIGDAATIKAAIESFPGTDRRFEKLADNLYSDYGHHPVEISATLQMARELSEHIVLVYQPHQNTRQHQVRSGYTSCMELAEEIYWLPTYQSREDLNLPLLEPQELTARLTNLNKVVYSQLDNELWRHISYAREQGKLVLCMGAGSIDTWLRQELTKTQ
jgi:UDP-N-acetylmuramate--alanine ligase